MSASEMRLHPASNIQDQACITSTPNLTQSDGYQYKSYPSDIATLPLILQHQKIDQDRPSIRVVVMSSMQDDIIKINHILLLSKCIIWNGLVQWISSSSAVPRQQASTLLKHVTAKEQGDPILEAALDALLVPVNDVSLLEVDVPLPLPDIDAEVVPLAEDAEVNEVMENDTDIVPLVASAQNFCIKSSAVGSSEVQEDWIQDIREDV
ncbi:hypothetical protein BT96DRAFT_948940 [Gymnopus androsaceus JB14]|uniref:Uncharacterized protein n=1 Tax=Gymnopus androsaceus JB14 TaxID=1447944 RepID=A0A6A4GMW8_9AGAR|nr:hypothetical protein BT96DRAFT_948940 [Gymnopus androsaceus JB14]